ncbi:cuticle protein 70, isoforms A and B-like [Maniola hyperantus]|uniref:cuticle protein 70, isoforms A and B-like n=1 Tax=Aphantopus hyperantus TaxID=2795564 RepID=UPI0037489FC8
MSDYIFTSVATVNMRSLVLFALLSVAAAKPKPGGLLGGLGGWDGGLSYGHAPLTIAQPALTVAHAPVIQAAPVVHAAPVAIAAKAATSYSSFQRVIHPAVAHQVVAQPVVHAAPVVAQPVVHAAPLAISHAPIASYGSIGSIGSIGHGWGQGW